ncbi:hypothetical protein Q5762_24465 [Streptomyces sp. P9(2023)]|uniref:hypothetical protein n=1 Tax=Streptomyces sp. P9(2023) TaxID=3064394 RepID=UPI0028F3EB07|nr:hypothetical protein [Streptomyces sp. P9(2023)]MDT9691440.1 hypothetical protein [Streptomyces sp. P9(2023)]
MRRNVTPLLLGLTLAAAGCGAADARSAAVAEAAAGFEAALRDQDTMRACAALAPATREELARHGPCATALASLDLVPAVGRARRVDVFGSQARAVFAADTLFLAAFPDGWKVTAAGCVPRPPRPYRCAVDGD